MSLYSHEEICDGCKHVIQIEAEVFYDHTARIADCRRDAMESVDPIHGGCNQHEEGEPTILKVIRRID